MSTRMFPNFSFNLITFAPFHIVVSFIILTRCANRLNFCVELELSGTDQLDEK